MSFLRHKFSKLFDDLFTLRWLHIEKCMSFENHWNKWDSWVLCDSLEVRWFLYFLFNLVFKVWVDSGLFSNWVFLFCFLAEQLDIHTRSHSFWMKWLYDWSRKLFYSELYTKRQPFWIKNKLLSSLSTGYQFMRIFLPLRFSGCGKWITISRI